jgi:hypothetical protein
MIPVPFFDLKFLFEFAAGGEELQIGGTGRPAVRNRQERPK